MHRHYRPTPTPAPAERDYALEAWCIWQFALTSTLTLSTLARACQLSEAELKGVIADVQRNLSGHDADPEAGDGSREPTEYPNGY